MEEVCHFEIEPIDLLLEESLLFRKDAAGCLVKVKAFAISSYPGHTLTFKIMVEENGAVFDYIPLHKLYWKHPDVREGQLSDLVYCNSPDKTLCIQRFEHLTKTPVWCFIKSKKEWIRGKYFLTVDWYENNENLNIIFLDSGQIGAFPNHKCLFREEAPLVLPGYKAIKEEWKITK